MRFLLFAIASVLVSSLGTVASASAQPMPVTGCPDFLLVTDGEYELLGDLSCNMPIEIAADGVTLNLRGYTLSCTDPSSDGITSSFQSGMTIKNGTVSGCNSGIFLFNTVDAELSNLTVTDSAFFGVFLRGSGDPCSSNSNKVLRSKLTGNGWGGTGLWGSCGNTLRRNEVTDNSASSGAAIYLFSSSDDNVLVENEVSDNSRIGVRLQNSSRNEVRDNDVHGNGQSGIALLGASDDNVVRANESIGNGIGGILLAGPSTGNLVADNEARDNASRGISAAGRMGVFAIAAGNVFRDNEAKDNGGDTNNGHVDLFEGWAEFDLNNAFDPVQDAMCHNTWEGNEFDTQFGPYGEPCIGDDDDD